MTGAPGPGCRRCGACCVNLCGRRSTLSGRGPFFCCPVTHDFVWSAIEVIRRNFKLTESLNAHQENRQRKKSQIAEIKQPKHGLSSLQSPLDRPAKSIPLSSSCAPENTGLRRARRTVTALVELRQNAKKHFAAARKKRLNVKMTRFGSSVDFQIRPAGYWSGGVPGLFFNAHEQERPTFCRRGWPIRRPG